MREVQALPLFGNFPLVAMNCHAGFVSEKIPQPEIVITGDIVDGNSTFHKIGELENNLQLLFGDGVLVLEPEIKEISENDKSVTAVFDQS